MPSRNVLKIDAPDSYYHVYARGGSKQPIFIDTDDFATFLNLCKRYLSKNPTKDRNGLAYPHLYNDLTLLCFCLMKNHFHLLLYQKNRGAMQRLMRGVMTSYSRYFNKKYTRSGPLFESRYKASIILNQAYLEHISRYIHLNPKEWPTYSYSSLQFYMGRQSAEWIEPSHILQLFTDKKDYLNFLSDYQGHKKILDQIKRDLANN